MPLAAASPLSQRTPTRLPGAAAALRRRIDAWFGPAERIASGATFVLGTTAAGVMLALGPLPPTA